MPIFFIDVYKDTETSKKSNNVFVIVAFHSF